MRQLAMQYQIADRDDLLPEVRQHSEAVRDVNWRQQANARFQLRLTPFFAGSGRMVAHPEITQE
jgi:hypothetical protein